MIILGLCGLTQQSTVQSYSSTLKEALTVLSMCVQGMPVSVHGSHGKTCEALQLPNAC
jgi:hypothetical protein